jgi:DNA-binding NtrC family response regulator
VRFATPRYLSEYPPSLSCEPGSVRNSSVLVVADDALIGALMGSLVELSGHRPLFPAADESPTRAIARIAPRLVLLDCEHDISCEEEVFKCAQMVGARVLLFSAARTQFETEELAKQRGISSITLPIRYHDFRREIENALQG